ncbi:hypothetical protein EKO27_g5636 [Xylaria grammica]|uniref:Phosphatidate cytidylyltransferase n=1 Tax=Xylaria grammica TaxID=363999 RepID=A0A439D507_9PEZI|nr:hypothetical protein EKO27_g5636 [Xylaria grammica]
MPLLQDGTVMRRFRSRNRPSDTEHEDLSTRERAAIEDVTQTIEGLNATLTFTFKAAQGEEVQRARPANTRPGFTILKNEKDLAMPVMDGFEATRLIRAFEDSQPPDHRRALIVGLTAHYGYGLTPNASMFSRSPSGGFDLLLSKPIRMSELYDMFLGGPDTNIIMLYGSLTEEEKSGYPRLLEKDPALGDDPRSNAIRAELERRLASEFAVIEDTRRAAVALKRLLPKKSVVCVNIFIILDAIHHLPGAPSVLLLPHHHCGFYGFQRLREHHNAAEPPSAASPPSSNLDSIAFLATLLAKPFSTATTPESRRDSHLTLNSAYWPLRFYDLRHIFTFTGTVSAPVLPPYPFSMSSRTRRGVPATPRVISPSPTPSDATERSQDGSGYFGPVTRSAARRRQTGSVAPQLPIQENLDEESDPELRRARTRSRSPIKSRKMGSLARAKPETKPDLGSPDSTVDLANGTNGMTKPSDGLLAPPSLVIGSSIGWNWRDFSRSPSPLGLIPIHRHFQTLIHKHEVPRKALHVSIGFFVYWLYVTGTQTSSVPPYLMAALIPIASVDFLRHKYASLNRFYVKYLGALMRETEYAGWNGVIFYLLGAWIVLRFFPKDVSVVAVMLLSWCDTAASTFGRLYGRYTPRIRRGKSLAGSFAAFLVGVATAGWFWGALAPRTGPFPGDDQHPFMFQGVLRLPASVADVLGLDKSTVLGGPAAVGVMSLWSGLVAAGSEVIDLFGWDDNLTIPVLSGLGIWGFLKIFG